MGGDKLPTAWHYDGIRRAACGVLVLAEALGSVRPTAGPPVRGRPAGLEDAAGARVPLGPPPVPKVDDGVTARVRLPPGQRFTFQLGNPFGFDLDPGIYRVRFYQELPRRDRAPASDWVGTLQSDWVAFEVVPR